MSKRNSRSIYICLAALAACGVEHVSTPVQAQEVDKNLMPIVFFAVQTGNGMNAMVNTAKEGNQYVDPNTYLTKLTQELAGTVVSKPSNSDVSIVDISKTGNLVFARDMRNYQLKEDNQYFKNVARTRYPRLVMEYDAANGYHYSTKFACGYNYGVQYSDDIISKLIKDSIIDVFFDHIFDFSKLKKCDYVFSDNHGPMDYQRQQKKYGYLSFDKGYEYGGDYVARNLPYGFDADSLDAFEMNYMPNGIIHNYMRNIKFGLVSTKANWCTCRVELSDSYDPFHRSYCSYFNKSSHSMDSVTTGYGGCKEFVSCHYNQAGVNPENNGYLTQSQVNTELTKYSVGEMNYGVQLVGGDFGNRDAVNTLNTLFDNESLYKTNVSSTDMNYYSARDFMGMFSPNPACSNTMYYPTTSDDPNVVEQSNRAVMWGVRGLNNSGGLGVIAHMMRDMSNMFGWPDEGLVRSPIPGTSSILEDENYACRQKSAILLLNGNASTPFYVGPAANTLYKSGVRVYPIGYSMNAEARNNRTSEQNRLLNLIAYEGGTCMYQGEILEPGGFNPDGTVIETSKYKQFLADYEAGRVDACYTPADTGTALRQAIVKVLNEMLQGYHSRTKMVTTAAIGNVKNGANTGWYNVYSGSRTTLGNMQFAGLQREAFLCDKSDGEFKYQPPMLDFSRKLRDRLGSCRVKSQVDQGGSAALAAQASTCLTDRAIFVGNYVNDRHALAPGRLHIAEPGAGVMKRDKTSSQPFEQYKFFEYNYGQGIKVSSKHGSTKYEGYKVSANSPRQLNVATEKVAQQYMVAPYECAVDNDCAMIDKINNPASHNEWMCDMGHCVARDNMIVSCLSGDTCANSQMCLNGQCRAKSNNCSSHADCNTSSSDEAQVDRMVCHLGQCVAGSYIGDNSTPAGDVRDLISSLPLGAIEFSNPVIVNPPNLPYKSSDYVSYKKAYGSRDTMLYVGANDGMLHAFILGKNETADGKTENYAKSMFDTVTSPSLTMSAEEMEGQEVWSFIPKAMLPKISDVALFNNSSFVNGTPVATDIRFTSSDGSSSSWHSILVGGFRDGGRGYYALDVTDPANPQIIWEIDHLWQDDDDINPEVNDSMIVTKADEGESVSGLSSKSKFAKDAYPFARMGYSFAEPAITNVVVNEGTTDNPQNVIVPVAILPGGLSTSNDPNDMTGKVVYIVRLDVLAEQSSRVSESTTSFDKKKLILKTIKYDTVITGTPAVYPSSFNTIGRVVYFGDENGALHRIDMSSTNVNDWEPERDSKGKVIPIFDPNTTVGVKDPTSANIKYERITYKPAVSALNNATHPDIQIAFGTGDSSKLQIAHHELNYAAVFVDHYVNGKYQLNNRNLDQVNQDAITSNLDPLIVIYNPTDGLVSQELKSHNMGDGKKQYFEIWAGEVEPGEDPEGEEEGGGEDPGDTHCDGVCGVYMTCKDDCKDSIDDDFEVPCGECEMERQACETRVRKDTLESMKKCDFVDPVNGYDEWTKCDYKCQAENCYYSEYMPGWDECRASCASNDYACLVKCNMIYGKFTAKYWQENGDCTTYQHNYSCVGNGGAYKQCVLDNCSKLIKSCTGTDVPNAQQNWINANDDCRQKKEGCVQQLTRRECEPGETRADGTTCQVSAYYCVDKNLKEGVSFWVTDTCATNKLQTCYNDCHDYGCDCGDGGYGDDESCDCSAYNLCSGYCKEPLCVESGNASSTYNCCTANIDAKVQACKEAKSDCPAGAVKKSSACQYSVKEKVWKKADIKVVGDDPFCRLRDDAESWEPCDASCIVVDNNACKTYHIDYDDPSDCSGCNAINNKCYDKGLIGSIFNSCNSNCTFYNGKCTVVKSFHYQDDKCPGCKVVNDKKCEKTSIKIDRTTYNVEYNAEKNECGYWKEETKFKDADPKCCNECSRSDFEDNCKKERCQLALESFKNKCPGVYKKTFTLADILKLLDIFNLFDHDLTSQNGDKFSDAWYKCANICKKIYNYNENKFKECIQKVCDSHVNNCKSSQYNASSASCQSCDSSEYTEIFNECDGKDLSNVTASECSDCDECKNDCSSELQSGCWNECSSSSARTGRQRSAARGAERGAKGSKVEMVPIRPRQKMMGSPVTYNFKTYWATYNAPNNDITSSVCEMGFASIWQVNRLQAGKSRWNVKTTNVTNQSQLDLTGYKQDHSWAYSHYLNLAPGTLIYGLMMTPQVTCMSNDLSKVNVAAPMLVAQTGTAAGLNDVGSTENNKKSSRNDGVTPGQDSDIQVMSINEEAIQAETQVLGWASVYE